MISPSSSCWRIEPGNGPQMPTAPAPRAVKVARNRLSPDSTARFKPPTRPPGISTSIATSPEMNIIAPASETSFSPGCSETTTAGACPSRTLASIGPIVDRLGSRRVRNRLPRVPGLVVRCRQLADERAAADHPLGALAGALPQLAVGGDEPVAVELRRLADDAVVGALVLALEDDAVVVAALLRPPAHELDEPLAGDVRPDRAAHVLRVHDDGHHQFSDGSGGMSATTA